MIAILIIQPKNRSNVRPRKPTLRGNRHEGRTPNVKGQLRKFPKSNIVQQKKYYLSPTPDYATPALQRHSNNMRRRPRSENSHDFPISGASIDHQTMCHIQYPRNCLLNNSQPWSYYRFLHLFYNIIFMRMPGITCIVFFFLFFSLSFFLHCTIIY